MDVLWFLVYWGVIITGTVLMGFFRYFWVSGRFSIRSKVCYVIKRFLIIILVVAVIICAAGALLLTFVIEDHR